VSWTDRLPSPSADPYDSGERARSLAEKQTAFVALWRDRRWARTCVVCGQASTKSVEFVCGDANDYLLPRELRALGGALPDFAAPVPVCFRHERRTLWPVRVTVAVFDVLLIDRVQTSSRASEAAAGGFTVRNDEGFGL